MRASRILAERFCVIGNEVSHYTKKAPADAGARIRKQIKLLCVIESLLARECSCYAKLILDAEKLIVLRNALGSGRSTCLDLAGVQSDSEVSDCNVFCLTGSVGNDRCHIVLMSELDRFDRLGNGTDLVQLDQDGVACLELDALLQSLDVGNEEVVADELALAAESLCHLYPAIPVFFIKTILDGVDRILVD